jgi:PadR family transcriptional regulator, regulatory protein AphA
MDVRTQCLGLLMRGPASGYELKKLVEEGPFCHFLEASFASIYPALTRLTHEGLVTVTAQAQAGRPDKKIYAITSAGRLTFLASLEQPLEDDTFRSPWFVAMHFAELLPPDRVRELIAERIAACEALLAKIEQAAAVTPGESFVAGLGVHLITAELSYLKQYGSALARTRTKSSSKPASVGGYPAAHDIVEL